MLITNIDAIELIKFSIAELETIYATNNTLKENIIKEQGSLLQTLHKKRAILKEIQAEYDSTSFERLSVALKEKIANFTLTGGNDPSSLILSTETINSFKLKNACLYNVDSNKHFTLSVLIEGKTYPVSLVVSEPSRMEVV